MLYEVITILIQELFETPYFCKDQNTDYFQLATTVEENPAIAHFQRLAAELSVVLPVSFFERQNNAFYNSVAIVDADGSLLGVITSYSIHYTKLYDPLKPLNKFR